MLPRSRRWLLAIPGIALVALGAILFFGKRGENLTLVEAALATTPSGQRVVAGTLRNDSDEPYSSAQLDIDMLASDGTLIATAYATAPGIAPRSFRKFDVAVPFESAARFRITKLTCSRGGREDPALCSLGDTVDVR